MALPPLVLRIVADSKGVTKGVAETEGKLSKLKAGAALAGKAIGIGLGVAAVAGIVKSIGAAREAATAQLKLQNSIANSAKVSKDAAGIFTAQADALRDLTGVDDEAIVGAQAFMIQMGLTQSQVKELTPYVVDLSEKMGVDLETAAKAVGKSVNGTTGGLQRMGVVVDKTKAQTDAYGATVEALGVAQGFAAKQARLEPWRKIGAQFEELGEKVGGFLLPIIRALFNWINDKAIPFVVNLWNTLRKKLGPVLGDLWSAISEKLWPAFKNLWDTLRPLRRFLAGAFVVSLGIVLDAIVLVVNAVADLVQNLKDAVEWLGRLTGQTNRTDFEDQPGLNPGGGVNPFNPFGRQSGGFVTAGVPVVVGEAGREIFVPRTSGDIVPNDRIGGVTINVMGDVNDAAIFERKVTRALERAAARA